MEMDGKRPYCPILDVDGVISGGKQFDLDITLPEDNRDVIYGVVKDCFKEPVDNAVVKLVEVVCEHGKEERRPIGHTFTDKEGEFVFGPLCPGKEYALQIWVNDTKKIKICAKCHHEGKCLRGEKCDKCDCFLEDKKEHCDKCEKEDYYDKWEKEEHCDKCEKEDYHDKCEKKEHCDKCKKEDCHDKCEKKEHCDKCEKEDYHDKCEKKEHCDKCEKEDYFNKCNKKEYYNKCDKKYGFLREEDFKDLNF